MSSLHADVETSLDQIRLSRRKRRVAVVIVYGDESSDETQERVYAVAGLFGNQEQWDHLESKWLGRTRGKVFHAVECESDSGEYKGVDHKLNLKLYADLANIIADSGLLGFGVALDLKEYFRVFPSCLPEQPYLLGFRDVIVNFGEIGFLAVPRETVEYIFDRTFDVEYNATFMYDQLANMPEWEFHSCLADKVSFATRKTVGIQAADLIARETMKQLDNRIGPKRRLPRISKEILDATGRFRFRNYTRDVLESLRHLSAAQNIPDAKMSAYVAWLQRKGLVDNVSNRFQYLALTVKKIRDEGPDAEV